jgi:hypothetical protein
MNTLNINTQFNPIETIISVGNKRLAFHSLTEDEQRKVNDILLFVTRTYDKILSDVTDEKILEATKFNRDQTVRDFLKKDKSHIKDPSTDFASAFVEGMGTLFGGDKYSRQDLRQAYEGGFHIGYEQGVYDQSRERRNPLSHLESGMTKEQEEFYNKFLDLCNQYNIRIEYTNNGMNFYPLKERFWDEI